MTQATDEVIQKATSQLALLRDEMRLKVHLAGMEARARWEEDLGPRLESLHKGLSSKLRGAGEARLEMQQELGRKWTALEPQLLDLVESVLATGRAKDGGRLGDLVKAARDAVGHATA